MNEFDVFEFLMDYSKFDIDTQYLNEDDNTLLMKIICHDINTNYERVIRILNHTKNINLMNNNGETALYIILADYNEITYCDEYDEDTTEHLIIITELLKNGANANSITIDGDEQNQILSNFVIRYEMIDVLKLILEHSKHDITDEALYYAIHFQNYNCVEILLNHIKDINKPIWCGKNAIQLALEKPDENIIELLRLWGCGA